MKFLKYLQEWDTHCMRDIQLNPNAKDYYEMRMMSFDPKRPLVVRFIGFIKRYVNYRGKPAVDYDLRVASAFSFTHDDMFRCLNKNPRLPDRFWGCGVVKGGKIDYSGSDYGIIFAKGVEEKDLVFFKKFFTNLTFKDKKYML
jgi:hypothetical protein